MAENVTTLEVTFDLENGKKKKITISNFDSEVADSAIKTALTAMVTNKLFAFDGSPITMARAANRITRQVTPVNLA